ncbi:MAG TPA: agmatine deiminase family protein [Solirubrobacteraceae bacterium]
MTVETIAETPRAAGLLAPARTGAHDRTLVAWPTTSTVWGPHRERAVAEYEALIRAIARFEPVTVIADPDQADEAHARCEIEDVSVLELPIDDSWVRDSGPIYLVDRQGGVALVQFRFNAWGEKYSPYDRDADLPRQLALAGDVRRYASPLVMEGGGFNVDGEGTLITTESVVLNANRNPGWTREECEDALRQATGAEKILWLEHGLAEDRDTDGHSDNVVQFAGPGRVVVQVAPDRSNPNWTPLRENLERLRGATDAQGRRLEIIEIPQLPYTQEIDGTRYAVPYVNFYPVNGAIVVPRLDAPGESEAYRALAAVFPEREIVGVPSDMLAYGGGGVGCVTQHVPAGVPLAPQGV